MVKLLYTTEGNGTESSIPMKWESGYTDLGRPNQKKSLRKFECYSDGTAGVVNVTFSNEQGLSNSFNIDLSTNSTYYGAYFTTGVLTGRLFKYTITNNDMNNITIKKIVCTYDSQPAI